MPLSLFFEATDKDRGKFLDLNLPSFHAVIMIFCLNFYIGRWIGGDILFDSRLVFVLGPLPNIVSSHRNIGISLLILV